MSPQRHIIKRQVFELTVGRGMDAQRLQTEMSRIYRQRIVPLIDQYCTALSAPDRIHRIALLDLDLGQVDLQHLEEALVARISTQLSALLADQISAQERHAASPDTHPKTTSQLELFSLFAQTGSLPWWADAGQPHLLEDCLHHLLQYAPGPLCRVLRELAHDPRCLQRLMQHYGDASLAALCGVLAPALRGSLVPLLADLVAVLHTTDIPTAGLSAQRRTSAWSMIVSLASLRGQDYREPFSFCRELLPRLARSWQVTSAALLAAIRQALRQGSIPGRAGLEAMIERLARALPDARGLAAASLPALLARWQRAGGSLASLGALLAPIVEWVPAQEHGQWLAVLAPLESPATPGAPELREAAPGLHALFQTLLTPQRLPAAVLREWLRTVQPLAADGRLAAVVPPLLPLLEAAGREAPGQDDRARSIADAAGGAAIALPALLAQWQRAGGILAVLGVLLHPIAAWVPARAHAQWLTVLAPLESLATPGAPELREASHGLRALLQTLLTPQRLPAAAVRQWVREVQQIAATRPTVEVVQQLRQWLEDAVPEASLSVEPAEDSPVDLRFSDADELYIDNAGLVILWPFLERFFERLGLVTAHRFQDVAAVHRAVGLLQYLATADPSPPEYLLPLNKVLCGMALDAVWALEPPLTEAEAEECTNLLTAVIAHAPILHNMSLPGFRGTFLRRQGVLSARDGAWLLRVQRETYDVVLDRFPWSVAWVKLPWMNTLLRVEW
jgi:hypothetical protein